MLGWTAAALGQVQDGPLLDQLPPTGGESQSQRLQPVSSPEDLWPFRPPPGWFFSLDAFIPRASIHNEPTFLDNLSSPDLGWGFSPQAALGYVFPRGNALLASYQFLDNTGRVTNLQVNQSTSERLYLHIVDLDYQGVLHGPWCFLTFQWQIGARYLHLTHDYPDWYYWPMAIHDAFDGVGPHFGLNFAAYLGQTGVGLFGRGDGALMFGAGGVIGQGRGEVGLSWSPHTDRWMRFEAGYRTDNFAWDHAYTFQGPFLNCQIGF
jgi:hypothetical protein